MYMCYSFLKMRIIEVPHECFPRFTVEPGKGELVTLNALESDFAAGEVFLRHYTLDSGDRSFCLRYFFHLLFKFEVIFV